MIIFEGIRYFLLSHFQSPKYGSNSLSEVLWIRTLLLFLKNCDGNMPNYVMRLARIQVSKGSGFFKGRIRNSYLLVADPQRCFNNCLQYYLCTGTYIYTVPKVIEFPRYNMKCSGENVILGGIVHVVSGFPLHFMLYRGNFDCFSNRVQYSLSLWETLSLYPEVYRFLLHYLYQLLQCDLPPLRPHCGEVPVRDLNPRDGRSSNRDTNH